MRRILKGEGVHEQDEIMEIEWERDEEGEEEEKGEEEKQKEEKCNA